MAKEDRFAVIRYLVDKLRDVGKTKMQKLIYFLQYAFNVPLDYVFRMHYFGPYSEELDDDLIDMKLHDYIDITPNPTGYGYHIRPSSEVVDSMDNTIKQYAQQLNNYLDKLGSYDIQTLERLGTLHFVKHIEDKASKDEIIAKVVRLKPQFGKPEIGNSYEELENLLKAQ